MKQKGFVKYIIGFAAVLAAAFFSQSGYFKQNVQNSFFKGSGPVQEFFAKGSNWVRDIIYPKITGEVEKRGDMIKTEVAQEKAKVTENVGEKIKNYFSGIGDSIFHPGSQQNCQPATTTAPSTQLH